MKKPPTDAELLFGLLLRIGFEVSTYHCDDRRSRHYIKKGTQGDIRITDAEFDVIERMQGQRRSKKEKP